MTTTKALPRYCLVTVGATVGFRALTDEVLKPAFWRHLRSKDYTALHVQCGPDIAWAARRLQEFENDVPAGLDVQVFEKRANLVMEEMVLCKQVEGQRAGGLVICHAGTGTILDAWRTGVSFIVVPNKELLDDHQSEMAKHLAQQGYATVSDGSQEDLQEAMRKAELLGEDNKSRWPPHKVHDAPAQRPFRLWEIAPEEVHREQDTQMAHD